MNHDAFPMITKDSWRQAAVLGRRFDDFRMSPDEPQSLLHERQCIPKAMRLIAEDKRMTPEGI